MNDLVETACSDTQIVTIAFLALLTQSMSLSALMASGGQDLDTSAEIEDMGAGNVLCAAIASPPGSTDVIASTLYEQFGASSRWMPIITSGVCVVMAIFGSAIIPWMPKLLVGATVFLFAYQLFYEWMYENVRGFQPIDFAIVLIILGTVVFVGFMAGIAVGILLALLLFVLRYSMISAIQGSYGLDQFRSSVERSAADNDVLEHLDVVFARRYLDACDGWWGHTTITDPWDAAFRSSLDDRLLHREWEVPGQ